MKIHNITRATLLFSSAVLLAACGGGGGHDATTGSTGGTSATALDYSYPLNQQTEVPTRAPVVLHFTQSINGTDVASSVKLYEEGQTDPVPVSIKSVSNGRSLILTPDSTSLGLDPHQQYEVVIDGSSVVQDRTIAFTTQALREGPESEVVSDPDMKIAGIFPSGGSTEPVMDFSTLRLQFTQPLDRETVRYGDDTNATIALMDSDNVAVPAHVIVDGPYLTIDPKDNLKAGETYTLKIMDGGSGGIQSTYDTALTYDYGHPTRFTPQSSLSAPGAQPTVLIQKVAAGGTSELTGNQINVIPMNATLLGDNNEIPQKGNVVGILADLTRYPNITPLSIPRGTLLKSNPEGIPVNIGGHVYAGFDTGEVDVRFLSDASGYLFPNPYTDSPDAPRLVKLYMDVAISTENPTANAGVTQNITQLELIGTAKTVDGVIDINAVGVVEPEILGLERGYGTLSFQLQTYKNQTTAPMVAEDTTPPVLQSWSLAEDRVNLLQPGDPIILNFSEPLDPSSLKIPGALILAKGGLPVDIEYVLDGASIVIRSPKEFHNAPSASNKEYRLYISNKVTDLAGNQVMPESLKFTIDGLTTLRELPDDYSYTYTEEPTQINSPVLLSAHPGYPCVKDPTTRNLSKGFVGRCLGGPGNWQDKSVDSQGEPYIDSYKPDDNLPLPFLPSNQPITLYFSKEIDPHSIKVGGSFKIVSINPDGEDPTPIQGHLNIQGNKVTFYPEKPWKEGQIYKYTIGSNDYVGPAGVGLPAQEYLGKSEANCDGSESICGKHGYPIQTQPKGVLTRSNLNPPEIEGGRVVASYTIKNKYFIPSAGGHDINIFFKGKQASSNVTLSLSSMPYSDTNNNLIHEADPSPKVHGDLPVMVLNTPFFYNTEQTILSFAYDGTTWPMTKYDHQEVGPSMPDENADTDLDPGGLSVIPNSAKILSENVEGTPNPWSFEGVGPDWKKSFYGQLSVDGGNVGCGYDSVYDLSTGENVPIESITLDGTIYGSHPAACPERKFTYIKMALNATITQQYITGKGLKVLIWPSRVLTTSFPMYARSPVLGVASIAMPSGAQIMRMRYEKDDPQCIESESNTCKRTKPISGWITSGPDGQPYLEAKVDLYLDSPLIDPVLSSIGLNHNLHSYEISMRLSGKIKFSRDGRMIIEQRNMNEIRIDYKMYQNKGGYAWGEIPLLIKQGDIFINMISEPIKVIN